MRSLRSRESVRGRYTRSLVATSGGSGDEGGAGGAAGDSEKVMAHAGHGMDQTGFS